MKKSKCVNSEMVKAIRKLRTETLPKRLGRKISQPEFARMVSDKIKEKFGISVSLTLSWAQGIEYGWHEPSELPRAAIQMMIEGK